MSEQSTNQNGVWYVTQPVQSLFQKKKHVSQIKKVQFNFLNIQKQNDMDSVPFIQFSVVELLR